MTGYDGFTTPCSSDASDGGNGSVRPYPIVRRRACQDREHTGDSAPTEDIVCGIRSTHGGGASTTDGDVWAACWGKGYSGRQEKDWTVHQKEDMSVFGMKIEGCERMRRKPADGFDG